MRNVLHDAVSEKEYQAQIVELAKLHHWNVYHPFDSRRSEPGFPDLCLVRDSVIFMEVKTEKGRVSADQERWIIALQRAGAEVRVVRPRHWQEIVDRLK